MDDHLTVKQTFSSIPKASLSVLTIDVFMFEYCSLNFIITTVYVLLADKLYYLVYNVIMARVSKRKFPRKQR